MATVTQRKTAVRFEPALKGEQSKETETKERFSRGSLHRTPVHSEPVPVPEKNVSTKVVNKYKTNAARREAEARQQRDLRSSLSPVLPITFMAPMFLLSITLMIFKSSGWKQLALLISWFLTPSILVWVAPPLYSLQGLFLVLTNLLSGLLICSNLNLPTALKTVYYGATLFFSFGKTNCLLSNEDLRVHTCYTYRLAYIFSFHDFARSRYCKDIKDYNAEIRKVLWQLFDNSMRIVIGLWTLYYIKPYHFRLSYPILELYVTGPIEVYAAMLTFVSLLNVDCAWIRLSALLFPSIFGSKAVIMTPLNIGPTFQSNTLREFWTEHWDTGMQPVLYYNGYVPSRVLGLGKGISSFNTFVLSGILHYLFFKALGGSTKMCFMILLFFTIQPVIMAFEKRVSARSGLDSRTVFQLGAMVSAPLFYYPLAEIIETLL